MPIPTPPAPTPAPASGGGLGDWSDWEQALAAAGIPVDRNGPLRLQGASAAILDTVPYPPVASAGKAGWSEGSFLAPRADGREYFRPLPVAELARPQLGELLQARSSYKDAVFLGAMRQLEAHPGLAHTPGCDGSSGADAGACLLGPQPDADDGDRPARRVALLFGLDRYGDARIPQLTNPVADARAVARVLEQRLGFETRIVTDADKATMVRALNRLIAESRPQDSIVLYYAGHGMVGRDGAGYWLASDAGASDLHGWISNADVSRALANTRSRQILVLADSCYSGTLASESWVGQLASDADVQTLLRHRAVTVMASGGNEPVADGGREGHSLFAWSLVRQIERAQGWLPASWAFNAVRDDVTREMPQTPVYGGAFSAGHEEGAEYLFQSAQGR